MGRPANPTNLDNAVDQERHMLDSKYNIPLQADRVSCCIAGVGGGVGLQEKRDTCEILR